MPKGLQIVRFQTDPMLSFCTEVGIMELFVLTNSIPENFHDRLLSKNGPIVTVEYDTFSDFGKVRGYNVGSVDGIRLANGYHVLRPDFAASAGIVGNSTSNDDCW